MNGDKIYAHNYAFINIQKIIYECNDGLYNNIINMTLIGVDPLCFFLIFS